MPEGDFMDTFFTHPYGANPQNHLPTESLQQLWLLFQNHTNWHPGKI